MFPQNTRGHIYPSFRFAFAIRIHKTIKVRKWEPTIIHMGDGMEMGFGDDAYTWMENLHHEIIRHFVLVVDFSIPLYGKPSPEK